MVRSQEDWINEYKAKGALWFHDGNPRRPHALLASGKHSNGFFNSGLITENPLLLDQATLDLVEMLGEITNLSHIDRVVGPAMGAITLAHDTARHIGYQQESLCLCAYTEKVEKDDKQKHMVFKKTNVKQDETVLLVEDVISTGGSVGLTAKAVVDAGADVLPFVLALVNRSEITELDSKKIIALINRPMPMWMPDKCPLCDEGSEAIRPKGKENWVRLNIDY